MPEYTPNHEDPRSTRDMHYAAQSAFKAETQKQTEAQRAHLRELKAQRQDLRLSAASSAGNLGLRYQPATNDYIHLVRVDNEQVPLPPVPTVPEPLKPVETTLPVGKDDTKPLASKPKSPLFLVAGDTVLWLFTLVIGAFVGLGLATIAGLTWRSDSVILTFAVLLGIGVVGGLKMMVATLWRNLGHTKSLEQPTAWPLVTALSLTALGCLLDAYLGSVAIHTYILDRAFNAKDVAPVMAFFPLALAITTPILLASAALAYMKGKRELTDEEIANQIRRDRDRKAENERQTRLEIQQARHERYQDALESKLKADHDAANRARADHHEAVQSLEADRRAQWESLKANPEFKCLQGLIGQIEVLNVEIEEAEKQLTGYRISRGYEKSTETKSGEILLHSEQLLAETPSTNGHADHHNDENNGYLS